MPQRNSIKQYLAGGYYHLYNRGVEKRNIFEEDQDYGVFLSYLKTYLTPKDIDDLQKQLANPQLPWSEKDKILKKLRLKNFFGKIGLLAYCLMPNHYHLLVKQSSEKDIDYFMRSLNTRYVVYFNKKYKRVGPLFQGVYKAVRIETDEQLIYLSAYMHRNPSDTQKGLSLQKLILSHSSLPEYLGTRKTSWVKENDILSLFSKSYSHTSYEKFILGYLSTTKLISSLTLE